MKLLSGSVAYTLARQLIIEPVKFVSTWLGRKVQFSESAKRQISSDNSKVLSDSAVTGKKIKSRKTEKLDASESRVSKKERQLRKKADRSFKKMANCFQRKDVEKGVRHLAELYSHLTKIYHAQHGHLPGNDDYAGLLEPHVRNYASHLPESAAIGESLRRGGDVYRILASMSYISDGYYEGGKSAKQLDKKTMNYLTFIPTLSYQLFTHLRPGEEDELRDHLIADSAPDEEPGEYVAAEFIGPAFWALKDLEPAGRKKSQ